MVKGCSHYGFQSFTCFEKSLRGFKKRRGWGECGACVMGFCSYVLRQGHLTGGLRGGLRGEGRGRVGQEGWGRLVGVINPNPHPT